MGRSAPSLVRWSQSPLPTGEQDRQDAWIALRLPEYARATQANSLEYGVPNLKIGVTPPAVNLPPVVDPVQAQAGTVDSPITPLQVSATDPENTDLTYTVNVLPAGLSMDDAGEITGTPTAAGTTESAVTVTDAEGASASVSFVWTIVEAGEPGGNPCTATRDGDTVVLVWEPIDGENDNYQVRADGNWVESVSFNGGNTWTGADIAGAGWTIRSREGGVNTDLSCG